MQTDAHTGNTDVREVGFHSPPLMRRSTVARNSYLFYRNISSRVSQEAAVRVKPANGAKPLHQLAIFRRTIFRDEQQRNFVAESESANENQDDDDGAAGDGCRRDKTFFTPCRNKLVRLCTREARIWSDCTWFWLPSKWLIGQTF
jgi:hypothetical protein